MNGIVYIKGGFVPSQKSKGGRPRDKRLAEIDERAATDIIENRHPDERAAAIAYLSEYDGIKCKSYSQQLRNNRLKDLTMRIKSKVNELLSK